MRHFLRHCVRSFLVVRSLLPIVASDHRGGLEGASTGETVPNGDHGL